MDEFSLELNRLLVDAYRGISKLEADMLHSVNGIDLSIGELHMLEAIGESRDAGMIIGELAQRMELTPPTVTVAVNKLERKGYVLKQKSTVDKRSVLVQLTRQGRRVNAAHRYFHTQMVRNIEKLLNPAEQEGMLHGMKTLTAFISRALNDENK